MSLRNRKIHLIVTEERVGRKGIAIRPVTWAVGIIIIVIQREILVSGRIPIRRSWIFLVLLTYPRYVKNMTSRVRIFREVVVADIRRHNVGYRGVTILKRPDGFQVDRRPRKTLCTSASGPHHVERHIARRGAAIAHKALAVQLLALLCCLEWIVLVHRSKVCVGLLRAGFYYCDASLGVVLSSTLEGNLLRNEYLGFCAVGDVGSSCEVRRCSVGLTLHEETHNLAR
mmetsp:Transcript_36761/g.82820  ORF Transcript_36761/g.82820 Transcript_36761/m.82820 type:complete len:228 (-) Transcript_36761:271-954(-)